MNKLKNRTCGNNEDQPKETNKAYLFKSVVRESAIIICFLADSRQAEEWKSFIVERRKASGVP